MLRRIESTAGSRKPLVVLLVLVGVLAVTVAVQVSRFAGAADASSEQTSGPGLPYTISGNVSPPLHPGGAAVPIDVGFSNPNVGNGDSRIGGARVSSLVVAITDVTVPTVNESRDCSATDFAVGQFRGDYPLYVPHGASTLSSLGFEPETWPTLRMKETGKNQNGCKGAIVSLGYTGAP